MFAAELFADEELFDDELVCAFDAIVLVVGLLGPAAEDDDLVELL